jgi:hypothetical protein
MFYDKLSKGEDGLYHVRAFTDDRKRYFVQLNNVTITDVGEDLVFETDSEKITTIHEMNIQNAIENSQAWFGKALTEKTLRAAYTREDTLSAERIQSVKVFDHDKTPATLESLEPGEVCSVIVEFAGLWFAKKAFGPSWNLVQVKKHQREEKFDESYPEDYMFEDDE